MNEAQSAVGSKALLQEAYAPLKKGHPGRFTASEERGQGPR